MIRKILEGEIIRKFLLIAYIGFLFIGVGRIGSNRRTIIILGI